MGPKEGEKKRQDQKNKTQRGRWEERGRVYKEGQRL